MDKYFGGGCKKNIRTGYGEKFFFFLPFQCLFLQWEEGEFYVANINSPFYSLEDGEERVEELSFQVTGINPV